MTHLLNHPVTRQPCAFVACERGYVCLRCDYVTPQVRWFGLQLMQLCNPSIDIPSLIPQDFDSGLDYCYPQPFKPLIIALPSDMIGQLGGGRGKNKRPTIPGVILADCAHVRVIKPVTLWHIAMKAA